jgi:hypothetical protein
MTTTIKSHTANGYYVEINIQNKYNMTFYTVSACPCFDETRCGYPEKEMVYSLAEKKNAYATYNRYIKKYCK